MQAKVLSLDSLAELEMAIGRFASAAGEAAAGLRAEFSRRQAFLDEQEEDARAEVSHWREAVDNAEGYDELQGCLFALTEAGSRLGRVRGWRARVLDESLQFGSALAGFDRLLGRTIPASRSYLRSGVADLRAYAAVELLSGDRPSGAAPAATAVSPPIQGSDPTPRPEQLTDLSLPSGYVWVPLAQVSDVELAGVSSKDDYKKVSYDDMVVGLELLADEVLPRVDADPSGARSEVFLELDEMAGRPHEKGLQQIYDAFFGNEHIYLERQRGMTKFDITNGRHRIRVALDLGWTAIPARVKDLNQ